MGTDRPYSAPHLVAAEGFNPPDWGLINRSPAGAAAINALAGWLMHAMARRMKVHLGWWSWASNINDPDIFRFRVFTSPAAKRLRARIVVAAVRASAASQATPAIELFVRNIEANATTDMSVALHVHPFRDANVGPPNYRFVDFAWDVFPETTYMLSWEQRDLLQIVNITVWEEPRSFLEPATDPAAVDTSDFVEGRPIYDANLTELWSAYRAFMSSQGSVMFAWVCQDAGACRTIATSTATLVNIFDTGVTGYSATAPGFWVYPEKMGSFESDDVWIVCWVIFSSADFDFGTPVRQVSFVTSGATIGTIDLPNYDTSTSSFMLALQCRWTGAAALTGRQKIDVLCQNGSTTDAITIQSAGAYCKEPLDPRSIAGLVVWLAADRITGYAPGATPGTWVDSSGNGNHATAQGTPTWQTGVVSGKPVVRFNGTTDFFTIADSATYKAAKLTVFVVAIQASGAAGIDTLVCYPHAVAATTHRWGIAIDATSTDTERLQWNNAAANTIAAVMANVWRVWSVHQKLWGLSVPSIVAYRDSIYKADFPASDITYPTATGLRVGANGNGAELWQGDIAEVLIYDQTISELDRQALGVYLAEKYGLELGFDFNS